MLVLSVIYITSITNVASIYYTGCGDYICDGYKRSDDFAEWQDCIDNDALYNPESFDTNSFCTYCLLEKDGAGPCYCATKSECYSWWYGFGITMIVIGIIATFIFCRRSIIQYKMGTTSSSMVSRIGSDWCDYYGCLFCCGVFIGGVVLVCLAATNSGY